MCNRELCTVFIFSAVGVQVPTCCSYIHKLFLFKPSDCLATTVKEFAN